MDIDKEKAALDNVRCQLTFFDDYIKPKQDFLRTAIYDTVTFADIWYMFNPGDTVIDRLNGQAYRVIEVKSIKHRVRKPSKEMPNFWRDDSTAEFKDNPVFVHCIYVDFNGAWMGPVNRVFCISRFPNSKPVSTLPIYPARFAVDDGLEDDLVQRGKLFVEVAKVKHMHYSGLTLQTHDEVDSQVVVDFEEAFNRNPDWKPDIQSVFSVDMEDMMEAVTVDPVFTRTTREKDDDDSDVVVSWCVEECCEKETSHDDEYIEARLRDEQIGTRMSSSTSTVASVAIVPRDFSSPSRDVAFDKDELMIMAHRVPGFVLRNRKWAWLDLKNMTEVAVIGEDEGFGQLVLPSGHKDMVKSMIRQHFKNRKHMKDESNKTDIVRGKGKGLIMLLHGVPGVGKTSTAEILNHLIGDLGTTAKEVEEALETNFALAHRWNCILLIDEADVFLAERTRDDFVRNSLVAVFLRIMEYYAGVLILTTNRVGVFDEAFTSRIHISLYYPPLKRDATREIFQKNIERTKERYELNAREIDIREYDITKFAGDYYDDNKDARWNGRQIRNAFHSAIALAELEANDGEGDTDRAVVLSASHFGTVAAAYKAFTDYLHQTYGVDPARRARENVWRSDNFGQARAPNALTTRLNVADPRPPAPPPPPPGAPWPPQANYAGYGAGNDPRFAYPPGYPAYSYAPPDASYPTAAPGQPRDPMTGQMPYAAHAGSMARPTEHYTG
ncbi:P-loop containing nucleoside triphosphate hydrolase protein [Apiospora saccharicola]|uniref:P-loop containing nucleoside triphosphate hydrolase protein n=1 Tax=Apiospora saccharicola TaxID=335842 RepID=A0ABR1VKF0_9PEZI